ncbi:NUDIX domain-containing protein [Bacillus idriensis]|uniref:NUDIX domain-containing protein n=1 Tax=Metabacillus idriensis TaxID=324768 RepID=A0A6I2ML67_9BACI|nr:NUDIX domain-containing protein [Metabacillus idriensis]MRX56603.1 NUDIX domain-containing protein [Metabacillus idriensis]
MAVAFLINEMGQILFLQKGANSSFLAGHLVPIGGHIEENEMSLPIEACIREIKEETGLNISDISNLKLRYIVMRIKDVREVRTQYVFFGEVKGAAKLTESEEGSLSWIDFDKIPKHNVSATTKEIVSHYKALDMPTEKVFVGAMKSNKGNPQITWSLLEDWERTY